jgi:hypothetical protein
MQAMFGRDVGNGTSAGASATEAAGATVLGFSVLAVVHPAIHAPAVINADVLRKSRRLAGILDFSSLFSFIRRPPELGNFDKRYHGRLVP